jgi:ferritin
MISKKLQEAINEQINRELYSEYLYSSMRAWFASQTLNGFATWMEVQTREEHAHAMGFYTYLLDRGGKVELKAIAKPPVDFKDPLSIFKMTYEHEQFITKSINELMDLAIKEKDHAMQSFLKWYVDEQVEEENNDETIIGKLNLIKDRPEGLLFLDNELGQRVYTPPVISGIVLP